MNAIKNLLTNLCNLLVCACELFRYALIFLLALFSPKAVLVAGLLAVESQLAACKHQIGQRKRRRPRFTAGFRLLWVVLSKFLDEWEDLAFLMQPATVRKWHTTAFNYFWRWKSRRKGGRSPISKEMQNLIYNLSKENPLWGAEKIRDTLLFLNYDPVRKFNQIPRKSIVPVAQVTLEVRVCLAVQTNIVPIGETANQADPRLTAMPQVVANSPQNVW